MAAKIHPMIAWQEKPGLENDAWLEPEHVDEGHEATPTTHGVACNDWCLCNIWRPACQSLKRSVEAADAPFIHEDISAEVQVPRIEKQWKKELSPEFRSKRCCCRSSPSLSRAVLSVSWFHVFLGNLCGCVYGVAQGLFRPLVIQSIVEQLGSPKPDMTTIFMLIGILSVISLVEGTMSMLMMRFIRDRFGAEVLMMLSNLVQRKGLRIKDGVTSTTPAGLIGNDLIRISHSLDWLAFSALAFTILVSSVVTLVLTIGWAAGIALITFFILGVLNAVLGCLSEKQARHALKEADRRLGIMTEIITGIKAIKLCVWERKFLEHITACREAETVPIGKQRILAELSMAFARVGPNITAVACLLFLVLAMPNSSMLRPGPIFAAMNVFLALRVSLMMIHETIAGLHHISVSFERVTEYLLLPEVHPMPDVAPGSKRIRKGDVVMKIPGNSRFKWRVLDQQQTEKSKSGKAIDGGQSSDKKWSAPSKSADQKDKQKQNTKGSFCVSMPQHDIIVKHGEKVAVVGAMGSGKTSVLMAVEGHLERDDGDQNGEVRCIKPTVHTGYVPQKPFIVQGSIRLNIHMGRGLNAPGHQSRFEKAVTGAGLDSDLLHMHAGVDTEVGNATMSGGQQQRLTIARALYSRSDLLVLDDPLSAVDSTSAQTILNTLIQLSDTTVLMAMNQVRLVHHFDRVLIVDKGRVVAYLDPAKVQESLDRGELRALSSSGLELVTHIAEAYAAHSKDCDETSENTEIQTLSKQDDNAAQTSTKVSKPNNTTSKTDGNNVNKTKNDASTAPSNGDITFEGRGNTCHTLIVYIKSMGVGWFGSAMTLALVGYIGMGCADRVLSYWMQTIEREVHSHEAAIGTAGINATLPPLDLDHGLYLSLYTVFALVFAAGLFLEALMMMVAGMRSSNLLHFQCLDTIMHAPVSWFEATSAGRIISRFSSDLSVVDLYLPRYIDSSAQLAMTILLLGAVLAMVVPVMLPQLLVCFCLFGLQMKTAMRISQDSKHIANDAMNPVQSTLAEIEQGRLLIRTMRLEKFFNDRFMWAMNQFQRADYFSHSVQSWLSFVTSLIALLLAIPTAFVIVLTNFAKISELEIASVANTTDNITGVIDNADAGLALTYGLSIPFFMNMFVQYAVCVLLMLTSLERLLEFADKTKVPQQPAWSVPNDPGGEWPSKGAIDFENTSLVYKPGLPPALKKVSLRIEGGERIGVVGPSGAGKSSLLVLLFRLLDPHTGRVLIDGVDTRDVGLLTLRHSMAIIPQSPLLLEDTVRKNLDPFDDHSTAELKKVLSAVGLSPNLLDDDSDSCDTQGKDEPTTKVLATSLSSGEKQMLNLARAMLFPHIRVLVCDEPTSNIDMTTDRKVQKIIRTHFKNCTIITIAHRLETVVDHDKIIVMKAGAVVEFGPPLELLQRRGGVLRSLGKSSRNLNHLVRRASVVLPDRPTEQKSTRSLFARSS